MKTEIIKSAIIIIFTLTLFLSGYGQANYSETYNYLTDRMLGIGETPDQTVCKTTFIREKIDTILKDSRVVKFQIQTEILPDNFQYYLVNAMDVNDKIIRTLVGDYPCPETCYPPETEVIPPFDLFDRDDVSALLANYPSAKYINIHSAKRVLGTSTVFSHAMYAVSLMNGTLIAHDENSDTKFISTSLFERD